MEITKVGDSFQYLYNSKSKKVYSIDKRTEELAKWINGEMGTEEMTQGVNGYDQVIKADLNSLFHEHWDSLIANCQKDDESMEEDMFQISINIDNPLRTVYKVNGEEVFISEAAIDIVFDDLEKGKYTYPTMICEGHKEYDESDNSVGIAIGDTYDIGNNRSIYFGTDGVSIEGGDENDSEELKLYYEKMKLGVEKFLYASKSEWLQGTISNLQLQEAMDFLQMLGVDISKSFKVNGAKYHVKNKSIQEEQYVLNAMIDRKTYYASIELVDLWSMEVQNCKNVLKRNLIKM